MRGLTTLFILAAAAWTLGFLSFVAQIKAMDEPPVNGALEVTDAIVVLTGGSERVAKGVELLGAGKARKLLISGAHPGVTPENLPGSGALPRDMRECCVALGHVAASTIGNAWEASAWLKAEHFRSARLVTANYHMPRSLLLFHAAMPDEIIVPHPVTPDSVRLDGWWRHSGTASLLATEYSKYLWVRLRLWMEEPPP